MKHNTRLRHCLMIFTLLTTTACLSPSPSAQFYLLEPQIQSSQSASDAKAPKILLSLATVRIPQYLERPQLVTANATNTYELNEWHRWAESLDENITRVLQQDLTHLIPAEVIANRQASSKQAALHLSIQILAFHADATGQALLTAQWQLNNAQGLLFNKQSHFQAHSAGPDASEQVKALNQCLTDFSREISLTIQNMQSMTTSKH